jgi:hypothetical protein
MVFRKQQADEKVFWRPPEGRSFSPAAKREALFRWFERLGRLGRNLSITVNDVWVKGLPNNTVIIIRWSAADKFPDGSPYYNHGVHIAT